MAETVGRECEIDGCHKPHLARGLCSTHYNQRHQPNRHRKVAMRCSQCGADCEKEPSKRKPFCSLGCRDAYRLSTPEGREQLARFIAGGRRLNAACRLRKAAEGSNGGGLFSSGHCDGCGQYFMRRTLKATCYCSTRCYRIAKANRRKAAKPVGAVGRLEIFERDGWRCHLCGRLTDRTKRVPDPMSATVDHLVPRAAGGGDDPVNLRTAHFLCNSRRREFGIVQLQLFG